MNNYTENQSNTQVVTNQSGNGWEWFVKFLRGLGVVAQVIVGIVDALSKVINQKK